MRLCGTSKAATAAWLLSLLLPAQVVATFWTVTSFYALSLTTSRFGTFTDDVFTYTRSYPVRSGVTPTVTAVSSTSYVYTYNDLTEVTLYLAPGAVPASDIITTTSDYSYSTPSAYTYYVEPITYTAPTSCPTAFTVTTHTIVNIPSQVTAQVTATATSTSVATYGDHITYVTAFLAPSAAPMSTPATTDFIYSYYVAKCRNPTTTGAAYYGPGGSSSASEFEVCSLSTGCTSVKTYVIVVATLIPGLFLLGFVESWFWFRNLMRGEAALRLGTICWCLISLWAICLTRTSSSRKPEDQARLRYQWSTMSGGTRFRLWWKWGFRHTYPTELLGPDARNPTGPGQDAPVMHMQAPPPGAPPGFGGPVPVGMEKSIPPGAGGQVVPVYVMPNGQYVYGQPAQPAVYQYGAAPAGQPVAIDPNTGQPYPMHGQPPMGGMYAPPPAGIQYAHPSPQPSEQQTLHTQPTAAPTSATVSPVQPTNSPSPVQTHQAPTPPQHAAAAVPSHAAPSELASSEVPQAQELRGSEVQGSGEQRGAPT